MAIHYHYECIIITFMVIHYYECIIITYKLMIKKYSSIDYGDSELRTDRSIECIWYLCEHSTLSPPSIATRHTVVKYLR